MLFHSQKGRARINYKKLIYLWNPIDHTSPFEEEIKGMHAIVIDQELSKIAI